MCPDTDLSRIYWTLILRRKLRRATDWWWVRKVATWDSYCWLQTSQMISKITVLKAHPYRIKIRSQPQLMYQTNRNSSRLVSTRWRVRRPTRHNQRDVCLVTCKTACFIMKGHDALTFSLYKCSNWYFYESGVVVCIFYWGMLFCSH